MGVKIGQPVLKISKVEQGSNTPIPGTVFTVEGIDSDYRQDVTTEADGFATLRVAPGSYRVTEKSVPDPYCLPEDEAGRTQTISLNGGDEKTLIFKNSKKPLLPGCTFQLRFLGGTSGTGGTVIGTKVTGKNGTAIWTGLTAGTYIVEEIDPADGYSIINASETVYISDKGDPFAGASGGSAY